MKKFTLVFTMMAVVFAQNAPIDFEADGFGANWTWTVFENVTNPAVEILANPDASAPNESATVAKFTALVGGQPWAGSETLHGADIGTFNLNETNSTIKIMVYKSVISDVGIKLVKPDGWSMGEIKVANTVVDEWEELTFDFAAQVTDGYDQLVIFPDFDLAGRTQDNICYFDNITFHPHDGNNGETSSLVTFDIDGVDDCGFVSINGSFPDDAGAPWSGWGAHTDNNMQQTVAPGSYEFQVLCVDTGTIMDLL